MALYRCNFCNAYDYDDEVGDSISGIDPGTQPEDFPEGWICPICGSDKTHLDPVQKNQILIPSQRLRCLDQVVKEKINISGI